MAEEEGADAVRLLTIHAAKGLEFKVVVVADAGRDRAAPCPDEILALSDGRFGFRVAHPHTERAEAPFDYEAVREQRRREDEAERLRLYYVAMTRAIDRLIVSGAIDPSRESERGDADRLGARRGSTPPTSSAAGDGAGRARARRRALLLRVDRASAGSPRSRSRAAGPTRASWSSSPASCRWRCRRGRRGCRSSSPVPGPPLHRVRALSFSALALFERCSYRYYAERVAGMRAARRERGRAR